eukprot:14600450-Ditylum_brightwellii.AAC.1
MKKEQFAHYGKVSPFHPLLKGTKVHHIIIDTSHHRASNSNNKEFGNMLRRFIMIAFDKQKYLMYIDHHVSPEDILAVTNNSARKDFSKYFVGFGQVQKDRAWIADSRVLSILWLEEIVNEESNQYNKYVSTLLGRLEENKNRMLTAPARAKRMIDEGANQILKHQVTKIQISHDNTTKRTVWRDATPKQNEKVILTQKWLYINFALKNPMFYQRLLNAENLESTLDVPLGSSTCDAHSWIPIKSVCAPTI